MKIYELYPFIKGVNVNICEAYKTILCERGYPRGASDEECGEYEQREGPKAEQLYKKLVENSVNNGYEMNTFCECCEYKKDGVGFYSLYYGSAEDIPIKLSRKEVKSIRLHSVLNSRRKKEVHGMEIEVLNDGI